MADPAVPMRFEKENGSVLVSLSGEVDLSNAESVQTGIERATAGADRIVIDLTAIEFFDSSGLRLLKQLSTDAVGANVPFIVVAPPNSIARSVLDITSMSEELAVEDSLHALD
jgi:anti-sigma B factor antagonist